MTPRTSLVVLAGRAELLERARVTPGSVSIVAASSCNRRNGDNGESLFSGDETNGRAKFRGSARRSLDVPTGDELASLELGLAMALMERDASRGYCGPSGEGIEVSLNTLVCPGEPWRVVMA